MGQYRRNHLCNYRNLREAVYPSSVPQDFCAFQERKPAVVYCNQCLHMEPGYLLSRGHSLLNLHVLTTGKDLESLDAHRSLL